MDSYAWELDPPPPGTKANFGTRTRRVKAYSERGGPPPRGQDSANCDDDAAASTTNATYPQRAVPSKACHPSADSADRYLVGRKIGEGQFGEVFRCTDRVTGERLALKRLTPPAGSAAAERPASTEVTAELAIMRLVTGHANIVALRAALYDDDGLPPRFPAAHGPPSSKSPSSLVMELCEGGVLSDRIKRVGPLPEPQCAALFGQMLAAVAHCHDRGVLHRDLKPANFLLVGGTQGHEGWGAPGAAPPTAKLADFGLSCLFYPGQAATDRAGSPYYVAPEVLRRSYGPAADVWSLGVTLFYMLSRAYPFNAQHESEGVRGILLDVLRGEPDFRSPRWLDISSGAIDLITSMLHPDPLARPTAKEALMHPWLRVPTAAASRSFMAQPHAPAAAPQLSLPQLPRSSRDKDGSSTRDVRGGQGDRVVTLPTTVRPPPPPPRRRSTFVGPLRATVATAVAMGDGGPTTPGALAGLGPGPGPGPAPKTGGTAAAAALQRLTLTGR